MNSHITLTDQAIIGAVKYMPAVSIILPFEPMMSLKSELEYKLKLALGKVEGELLANYPADKAMPVITRLQKLIRGLNYNTSKKGIAIFVSQVVEKVVYLDILVNEKIVIDESFEIRDLVYNKKQSVQYLVLLLSGESSKMYLGDPTGFQLIKSNVPDNINAYKNDSPEKIGNFSDPDKHKEVLLDKFLHHMDQGLTLVLKGYPLPVFLIGAEKVLGHFNKITKNSDSIVQHIHGNYIEATMPVLLQVMQPYLANWQKIREKELMLRLEKAKNDNKLVQGITEAWAEATHKNGRLLIVEKDFMYSARQAGRDDAICEATAGGNNAFYIKDAVDDVMEKVLESGGDIEFVDNGLLKDYGRIALIKYY